MKELEKTLKALANRRRLAIVKYLKENGTATVNDLAKFLDLSFKSTSKHLRVLASASIVEREQKSLNMHYYLESRLSGVAKFITFIV